MLLISPALEEMRTSMCGRIVDLLPACKDESPLSLCPVAVDFSEDPQKSIGMAVWYNWGPIGLTAMMVEVHVHVHIEDPQCVNTLFYPHEGRGLRNFSWLEDPQGFYIKRTLSSVNTFFMLP
jgi:hypothetical protein